MDGVKGLATAIKNAVDRRIAEEARAKRGKIQGGMFQSGSKSYPYRQAVDFNDKEGNVAWAQLTPSGEAVIVGE